jgi:geranylgeranyl reductase family protein
MCTSVHRTCLAKLPLVINAQEPGWDVAIVGAGPGGLSAAHAAASAGARTIVLERAEHPRYKTCGGGLIGTSLAIATRRVTVPARDIVNAITFTDNGRRSFTRRAAGNPVLTMVRRDDFDNAWYEAALSAGAVVRQNSQVRAIDQDDGRATVTLADGSVIAAKVVIGADGSAGISSRYVGVTFEQQDLGLEVEIVATDADRATWRGRAQLDWGPEPGSYGWVFPKDDELTVGVIMAKGKGAETKEYLTRLLAQQGLADREVRRDSGHLTRCRTPDAPLRRGRVLVVGDAAGLLEPWTREGISYALRSGAWAGEVAAEDPEALDSYPAMIRQHLLPEMAAGRRLYRVFGKHPHLMHAAMATPLGWRAFESFCRGELSMANVVRRPSIGALISLFGGRAVTPAPS